MIKRRKKQSFKKNYLISACLVACFVAFYLYASFYSTFFFVYLIFASLFVIGVLLYFYVLFFKKTIHIKLNQQEYLERINLLEADFDKENLFVNSLEKKIESYIQLKDLTEKLNRQFSLKDSCQTLSLEVNRIFPQKDVVVILYLFDQSGDLGIVTSKKNQRETNIKKKKGDMCDKWVVKTLKPLLIEDVKKDFRFDSEVVMQDVSRPVRSLMSVPLLSGKKAIGILRVDSPQSDEFAIGDVRLLMTIGHLGAIALDNAQVYEKIEDLAVRDGLTGLFLRRYLMSRLRQELTRKLRRKKDLSFMMVDIDEFKKYNDRFGHAAGDIVLKTIGMILADLFDVPGNLVCRYGGEEFAILLPDCPKDLALKLAKNLCKQIEMQTIILRRKKTEVTVSVGVASFPGDAQLKDELIQKADLALYEAKRKGRNRVCGA